MESWTLYKYYKENCDKCVLVGNLLAEILVDYPHVNLVEVDIATADAAALFAQGIRNLPTLVLMRNDVKVGDTWGFKPKLIRELIAQAK